MGNNFLGDDTMALDDSQLNNDYRRIRGRKYHEHRLQILTCLFEAITERISGVTYDSSNTASYRQWMHNIFIAYASSYLATRNTFL